jgi:chemotaxis protein MotA
MILARKKPKLTINFSAQKKLSDFQMWIGNHKNKIGLILFSLLFLSGFVIHNNMGLFFNLSGLLIVVCGTAGATLISFRIERLAIVYRVLRGSYQKPVKDIDKIIQVLVDLSVKSKLKGLFSLQEDEEEASTLFLRRGLGFLVDNYPLDQIRDLLNTEMYFFRMRREEAERILRAIAEMCPSFGLVGSVVGLIGMLVGVGDTSTILATVPIALTSTLYGVVLANFFFLPFAANIRERTDRELLLQKIIMEGIIAIGSDLHPRILETKLKSFLTPSSRTGKLVSYKRIQEKFGLRKEEV